MIDRSEILTFTDTCDKISGSSSTVGTDILSSRASLSSSNSIKDVSADVLVVDLQEKNNHEKDGLLIEVDESDGDAVYNLIVTEQESNPSPVDEPDVQLQEYCGRRTSSLESDPDNVANFIDLGKLVGKHETNYHYSPQNLASRKKVEKVKMKRNTSRTTVELDNLDKSVHSRMHYLRHCIKASAYYGPRPLMKDGSHIQSIVKKKHSRSPKPASQCTPSSRVAFSNVDIREYERVPGDNPCVRSGIPLSIGWKHVQLEPIPLETYEVGKGPTRDKIELMVPAEIRRSMLRDEFGASIHDLNAAMKSVNIAKRQRAQTLKSESREVLEEILESVKRKFKRVILKKQAKDSWEDAHEAVMNEYLEKALREEGLVGLDESFVSSDSADASLRSLQETFPLKIAS